ncbi:MAG: DUF5615 family PIN-like protein [Planctomycetota bacterium]|jgi:hypothetical protein
MPVSFYMDVHVPEAITHQLRRRGVDVVTAIEDGARELSDHELLARATELGRVIFTQDVRFRALAEDWQRQSRPFSGLVFGRQLGVTIGQFVKDLELIARASESEEWISTVEYLPL